MCSEASGSRQISTFSISTLSRAHPVTAMLPARPVVLVSGVSKLPVIWLAALIFTVTFTVCGELASPAAETVICPAAEPLDGRAEPTRLTVNDPLPVPEAGETDRKPPVTEATQPTPGGAFTSTVCGPVSVV